MHYLNQLNKRLLTLALLQLFFAAFSISSYSQKIAIKNDPSVNEQENLDVFQQWARWTNPGGIPSATYIQAAEKFYAARDSQVAKINSLERWKERQQYVKEFLRNTFSKSFVSTPLNATVTGVIKQNGYRIEKVVFESSPGYYVTGCVYVPEKTRGRVPAVLNLMGHDQEAFRAELYQLINANLALKGIVVLTIDPPGQGEMVQYYDTASKFSSVGYTVLEHCYFANQCFVSGISPAVHFVRDGMRAIDYLSSRKDVDTARIGVTGFSGGGTVTSFLSAVDDRVKVSIPSSWSTVSRRQTETKGTQDGETVLIHSLTHGITFADLIEVRAPKPTMMTFVSRDQYLSVQGAREAYNEAKKIYSAYGNVELIKYVEDDSKHWLTPIIRSNLYSFFTEHFGLKKDGSESIVNLLPIDQLVVTKQGQVSLSYNSKVVFEINRQESAKLIEKIELSRKQNVKHLVDVVANAKRISGYDRNVNDSSNIFFNGRYQRNNYSISKLAFERDQKPPVPFLLFVPADTTRTYPAIIYLDPEGKSTRAGVNNEIEKLVQQGYVVAAVDVFNIGELRNKAVRDLSIGYSAVLTGKSVTGIQAEAINELARYLQTHSQVNKNRISGISRGHLGFALIHAVAFENIISSVSLIDCPLSYQQLVLNKLYKISDSAHNPGNGVAPVEADFSWGVAGALTGYDIPDLLAAISPKKILISSARDHLFKPATDQIIKTELRYPLSVYASQNATGNFQVTSKTDVLSHADWMFR